MDLRTGRLQGCIQVWSRDDGSRPAPYWENVTDMLDDVANALHTKFPALRAYGERVKPYGIRTTPCVPEVEDRRLVWHRSA
ncbi:hypothetical protein AB0I60_02730 [Actinosynnema sp. NPDC050436]|uniref:hypothetical protein n=1 Tax=Actinosynnema sp. NPDC050436 TaxID=3155659 RepID=UPI0033CDC853